MTDHNWNQPGGHPPEMQPGMQPGVPGGRPQIPFPHQAPYQEAPGNGLAVAGMVLGIIGVALFFIPFVGLVCAVLGIALGGAGISKANKIGGKGKGMGIAGVACGAVGVLLGLYMIWAIFAVVEAVERQRW